MSSEPRTRPNRNDWQPNQLQGITETKDAGRTEDLLADHGVRAEADDFLGEVYRLDASKDLSAATDRVYDHIEQLLYDGSFDVCDRILARVDVDRLSTALMRSFLTITAPANGQLKARKDLYERVEIAMTGRLGDEKARRLFSKLD